MHKPLIYLSLLGSLFAGCAVTMHDRGTAQLTAGHYGDAVATFRQALETEPQKAEVWRDLGIAFYEAGMPDSALPVLQTAQQLAPNDGNTIFYLGAVYEKKHDFDRAIDAYRQYTRVGRFKSVRKKIENRLAVLTRKKMQADIQRAIATEDSLRQAPDSTVAVLHFSYLGSDENLSPLQKGLAELVSYDLTKVKALRVLERVRFQVLLDELKLAETGVTDSLTAPRIGRLLGARTLVMGSFIDVGDSGDELRITSQLVNIQQDTVQPSPESVEGDLDDFFRLEKSIVYHMLGQMNIALTEEERAAIDARPTEDLQAILAFSEGVDREDRGLYADAQAAFQRAQTLDPHFNIVRSKIENVQRMQQPVEALDELTGGFFDELKFENQAGERRLQASGAQVNAGALPGQDERDTIQESTGTEGFHGVPIDVEVVIPPGLKKK